MRPLGDGIGYEISAVSSDINTPHRYTLVTVMGEHVLVVRVAEGRASA